MKLGNKLFPQFLASKIIILLFSPFVPLVVVILVVAPVCVAKIVNSYVVQIYAPSTPDISGMVGGPDLPLIRIWGRGLQITRSQRQPHNTGPSPSTGVPPVWERGGRNPPPHTSNTSPLDGGRRGRVPSVLRNAQHTEPNRRPQSSLSW